MKWTVYAMLVVLTIAGCADRSEPDSTGDEPKDAAAALVPVIPDQAQFMGTIQNGHGSERVGHTFAELHVGAAGLDLAAYDELSDGMVGYGSGYSEVDVVGDLALVSSIFGTRGATLLNISEPGAPKVLSHVYNVGDNWDARLSGDGKYLFLGCQGSTAGCGSITVNGERPMIHEESDNGGIAVFDIQQPTNPVWMDFIPIGFTHNVYSFMVDERYFVMNQEVALAEWDPAKGTSTVVSTEIGGVHDIAVQQHPITGQWLLYTGASGFMSIWDVTNPTEPVLIGATEDGPAQWHEQTPMPCLLDGRHITIGAGESGGGVPQPVAVVDTTDPTNPVVVGEWILPDHASITAQGTYKFSLHNIDGNCQGQVAVGHYHAGVWVFDVSTRERQAAPPSLGYYLPSERPASPSWSPLAGAPAWGIIMMDTPNVWAAQWTEDGSHLLIPDMTTGLYVLKPTWQWMAAHTTPAT